MNKLIYGNKKGFSLIELIVVIAIIGILVMIAAPRFLGFTKKAEVARMQNNIKVVNDAVEMYHIDHGDWPRATDKDVFFTKAELGTYAEEYYSVTGEVLNLDEEGHYYDIDWDKIAPYVKQPKDNHRYILQNPVGRVYFMEKLTELGEERITAFQHKATGIQFSAGLIEITPEEADKNFNVSGNSITGLNKDGKKATTLQIPDTIGGQPIVVDEDKVVKDNKGTLIVSLSRGANSTQEDIKEAYDKTTHVAVSMVLDVSGSMGMGLDGHNLSGGPHNPQSRISILRNNVFGMIDSLSQNPNAHMSFIPFSSDANKLSMFYNIQSNKNTLNQFVLGLNAEGGTNTGDGIRRGFHQLNSFNDSHSGDGMNVKNIMFVLTDGSPTYYSVDSRTNNSPFLIDNGDAPRIGGTGQESPPNISESMEYINIIGSSLIQQSPLDIDVYVIGFSNKDSDLDKLEDIADFLNAKATITARTPEALQDAINTLINDINNSSIITK